jgi:hypothetical protein
MTSKTFPRASLLLLILLVDCSLSDEIVYLAPDASTDQPVEVLLDRMRLEEKMAQTRNVSMTISASFGTSGSARGGRR